MAGEIYEVQGCLKFGRGGPSCPSEFHGRTVSIECLEGNVFELPAEAACLAGRVRVLLLEHGLNNTLKFEIKRSTMAKVCEYLKHHRDHSVSEIMTPLPSDDLRDCGASRWDCSFVNVDHDTLFDIGFAATTLGIPSLDFLVKAKIACSTHNKSADKLRREYKMINDLSAKEESDLRRAYTTLQKSQGEEADLDLSQLAAASVAQSGIEAAKQQMMSLKDAEETGGKALNTKSWRRGMWSAAVKKDWQVLADAPLEIQADRALLESAIYASQGRALKYASPELRSDEELVLLATSFLGEAFKDAAPELRGNRSFVLKAVSRHGAALAHAEQFRADKSFLLEAAKAGCGSALQGASGTLQHENEFVLEMIIHDAVAYKFASEELRSDKEFAMEAARRNGAVLKFMTSNFQADLDIVQVAIARDPRAASFAHPSRRRELGLTERDAAIGEVHMAQEYEAQVEAGRKAKTDEESQAEMGPRQLHSEPICYTTMKLAKVVGFSAGSTMMGNFGQGNYVAANALVDLFPHRLRPEIDSSVIMWGAVGGGIGMRWKAFADQDVLLQEEDALLTMEDASKAVRYVCARMHAVPLVMPSKFDQTTRQQILQPTAGMIKLEIPVEEAKAAETVDWGEASKLRDQEALRNTAIIDRRPLPGNIPESSPLGGWPLLQNDASKSSWGKLQAPLDEGMRISLTGVRGKNGSTGSLLASLGESKWKVQLDNDMGSAIVHESNIEIISYSEGPVDQRTKDERTALRRAKIQEKRSQLLEKKAAKGNVVDQILATASTAPPSRKRTYYIAGTWNAWAPEEMIWNEDENHFSFSVTVGESMDAFQVLLDQQGNSCLHAGDVPQRCPQGGVLVQGPDPKWRCEGFNFKMAKAQSGCYSVRLLLDSKGFAKKVQWVPVR